MSQSPPLATVGMRMQDVGFQTQGPFCCGGRGPGEAEWRPLLGEHEDGRGAPGSGPKEGAERRALSRKSGPRPGARGSPWPPTEVRPAARVRRRPADTASSLFSSVRQDFDVPSSHLIGAHGYCTQVRGRGGASLSSSLLLPPCWSSARSLPVTASAGLTVTETWKGSSVQLPFLESWLYPIHMQRGPKRLTAAQAGGPGASGGQTAAMAPLTQGCVLAPLTQGCVFTALPSASSQRGPYEVSWGVGWGGGTLSMTVCHRSSQ